MTAQEEPIGIVGCGIAGVAFALGLAKLGKHSIIFEKDASFDTRNQGYGLTLQQGGKSLKILGLEQQVNQVSCSSSSHCIFNQDGKLVFAWGPSTSCKENIWKSGRNCHIPRQELRKLLFNQLDNEYTKVIWNADITAIHPKSTHIDIQMNGEKLQVKALVGCDGIHSQVRKFIFKDTKDDLNYLNVIVILGIVDSPLLLNDRVIQMSDGNMRIFAMPFNQKQCMWQCSVPMELEEASRLSRNGASSLKQFMMDSIKTWAHPVIEMITNTPLELITGYPVYDREPILELPQQWKETPITIIGDAAHPLSPFKGQGANCALLDAIHLCQYIQKEMNIVSAFRLHEQEMMKKAVKKVLDSRASIASLHCNEFISTQYQLERRGFSDISECQRIIKKIQEMKSGSWDVETFAKELKSLNE